MPQQGDTAIVGFTFDGLVTWDRVGRCYC